MSVEPLVVPKVGSQSISDGHRGGGIEQCNIILVAWNLGAGPGALLVSPGKPFPPETKSSAEALDIEHPKAPQPLGATNNAPVDESHALVRIRFGAPQKVPPKLIHLFESPPIKFENREKVN